MASPPRYVSSPPVAEGIRISEQRRHEEEAEQLRQEVKRLQADIDHLKLKNQSLEAEQRTVVGPLKEELQHNKELLVHAVQCIEDLAEEQRKLEAGMASSKRVAEIPNLVHSRRAPLAGQSQHGRRAATPKPPKERQFSMEAHPWGGKELRSPYGSRYIAADYGHGPSSSAVWRSPAYAGVPPGLDEHRVVVRASKLVDQGQHLQTRDGWEVPCFREPPPVYVDASRTRYYSAEPYQTPLYVPSPDRGSSVYPTPVTVYSSSARVSAPYPSAVSYQRGIPDQVHAADPRLQLLSNYQLD
eukprot:GGOE01002476.1.p1 GENE.GGOE01002476.1~~GGOE01002476.1.p1  ORF type:complete len:299 (+),score=51.98 GGOE01002476.1:273-1169(+)